MQCKNQHSVRRLPSLVHCALLILPAVALGIFALLNSGASPLLWGQQAAAWAVLGLLAWPLRRASKKLSPQVWHILLLLPLAATLLGEQIGGARRWLNLFVFQINAAMLVLPALLVALTSVKCPYPALLAAAAVLSFQPDASQLLAFSVAALVPVLMREKKLLPKIGSAVLLVVLAIRCFLTPITLEPVDYCEGILIMLRDISWVLYAAGWAALAAIPAFFLYRFGRCKQPQLLSLGLYYIVTILFTLSGNDPVPFLGFGLSPIAGYYLAYICAPHNK